MCVCVCVFVRVYLCVCMLGSFAKLFYAPVARFVAF